MTITPAQIRMMVESELASVHDSRVVSHIRNLLVDPAPINRAWDYGVDGERYLCWSVLDHAKSNTGIGYCEFGFGPRMPWGLVAINQTEDTSLGMDSGWFHTFIDAFFDSAAATDLAIWRVYKQDKEPYPGVPLTEESDWNSTWEGVYRLRAENPGNRYHCSQSIQVREIES